MMCVLWMSVMAFAQRDTIPYTVIDGMKIPLVEKGYVANTNLEDNWYVTLYAGVTSNWGSNDSHAGFFQVMGPATSIAVGKDVTPVGSVRAVLGFNRNTGVTDSDFSLKDGIDYTRFNNDRFRWNSFSLSLDYVLNFSNLILGFRENRTFHIQGILGLGGTLSNHYQTDKYAQAQQTSDSKSLSSDTPEKYQNEQRTLVAIRVGMMASYMIGKNWSVHFEATENMLDNSYDSNSSTSNIWDGHLDMAFGVSYRFNNKGGSSPGFRHPLHDMSMYQSQLDRINDLRKKTMQRRKELEEMADTIDVEAQVMYTLIAFDEGEETVDRLQQTNIYTTAYAWAKSPRSVIYIVNSTGVDDKLYQNRANAIRDILVERYEIPAAKIKMVPNEKDIKPAGDYIELIIND